MSWTITQFPLPTTKSGDGGRYSNLLKNLGYRKTEAVGAAVNLNI